MHGETATVQDVTLDLSPLTIPTPDVDLRCEETVDFTGVDWTAVCVLQNEKILQEELGARIGKAYKIQAECGQCGVGVCACFLATHEGIVGLERLLFDDVYFLCYGCGTAIKYHHGG
ncbi:E7 [Trichechus manatus latirostris papillomavirus 2]|uniref:Protein E7 n=1 Tax=Trichechus manatus latirostris papillomavirus 2 TaxID=1144379 RepID=H6UYR3_9PAPI|nr:TmPV2 E7 gene product [Trichechus manatus latirostris papillomavirus 2]AFA26596.1 E7 [Trichechus manatus latirostris papillomavirus 2]